MSSTISTTLGALAGAADALKRLTTVRLPIKPAYHLTKLTRLLDPEMVIFHERRLELLRQFGTEAAPGTFTVPPNQAAAFASAMTELCNIPVTIAWGPFDLAWLPDAESVTAADLFALGLDTPGALVVFGETPNTEKSQEV